jgi:hypothetical protein
MVDKKSLKGGLNIQKKKIACQGNFSMCVSKIEMSPLTAKLKCPHGRGKDIHESEAVTEARGDGFG